MKQIPPLLALALTLIGSNARAEIIAATDFNGRTLTTLISNNDTARTVVTSHLAEQSRESLTRPEHEPLIKL